MTDEEMKKLKEAAKYHIRHNTYEDPTYAFNLFVAETGWEDWMEELCQDTIDEDISDRDSSVINEELRNIWDDTEEEMGPREICLCSVNPHLSANQRPQCLYDNN